VKCLSREHAYSTPVPCML